MGHISVLVPDGHTIQVHPPVAPMTPMAPQGVIPSAQDGAKAAMDQVMPKEAPKPKVKKPAKKD